MFDILDLWQVQLGLLAAFVGLTLVVFKRYDLAKYLPMVKWLARVVRMSVYHWGARKAYKEASEIAYRYSIFLEAHTFSESAEVSRKWFQKFVWDTYDRITEDTGDQEAARRISNAFYTLIAHYPEILQTLKSLDDRGNLDVKRVTLIFIDFLGEFFSMSNTVDRIFYQDVIYGINQVLLELKKDDLSKKSASRISATLWRMYQLSKAYNQQTSKITRPEFQKKILGALASLVSYFK